MLCSFIANIDGNEGSVAVKIVNKPLEKGLVEPYLCYCMSVLSLDWIINAWASWLMSLYYAVGEA